MLRFAIITPTCKLQKDKMELRMQGANDRFQSLQRVYAMLGDENKYDGCEACCWRVCPRDNAKHFALVEQEEAL